MTAFLIVFRDCIKHATLLVLAPLCLLTSLPAHADVIREYCQPPFCYLGLNNEDVVAIQNTMGLPWNGEVTPVAEVDSVAPALCQQRLALWGYPFSHYTTELIVVSTIGAFTTRGLRLRCFSNLTNAWTFDMSIAAWCPLGWWGYGGFQDPRSPYWYAYPYNFGGPGAPDYARWCQKQCGLDEAMGNFGFCEKRSNLGSPPLNACAGNPINAAAGNKFQYEVDLRSLSGPFVFGRSYNSWDGRNLYDNAVRSMGRSWLHAFDRVVNAVRYATHERAIAYRQDGQTISFTAPSNINVFSPEHSWVTMRLERLMNGTAISGWKLTGSPANEIEIYLPDGRLSKILYASGHSLTMIYGDGSVGSPVNMLVRVQDAFERSYRLTYDTRRRVNGLIDLDGHTISFGYDDAKQLLTSVTYPSSSGAHTRTYMYNEAGLDGGNGLPRMLTGIVDENGQRYATYRYQANGAAQWFGARRRGRSRYRVTLHIWSSTTLVDARNTVRLLNLTQIAGRWLPTSQSQPAGSGCGASSSAITYDAQANVTVAHGLQQQQDLLCV